MFPDERKIITVADNTSEDEASQGLVERLPKLVRIPNASTFKKFE